MFTERLELVPLGLEYTKELIALWNDYEEQFCKYCHFT